MITFIGKSVKSNTNNHVAKHNFSFIRGSEESLNYLLDPDGNILLDPDGNQLLAGDGNP